MVKSRVVPIGVLAALAIAVVAGVLVFRAIDTGSSASAAPGAQTTQQQTTTPWLGVLFTPRSSGLTIAAVIADSPADKAGLQAGDIIKAVDGTSVATQKDLRTQIDGKAVGDTVTLTIDRGGQTQDVSVTLEAKPTALTAGIPLLPELQGIPQDQLFSHFQGGQFNFTDEQGNSITVTIDAGTVASVDTTNNTLTVNLNAGGSKTYTVGSNAIGVSLSDLQQGDNVVVVSVGNDVRAIAQGLGGLLPGLHMGHGFRGGRMGQFDGFDGGSMMPQVVPANPTSSGTGL